MKIKINFGLDKLFFYNNYPIGQLWEEQYFKYFYQKPIKQPNILFKSLGHYSAAMPDNSVSNIIKLLEKNLFK